MSQLVSQLENDLKDQPNNPLRHQQATYFREEKARLESVANAPPWMPNVDRGAARSGMQKVQQALDVQAARKIEDPLVRDRVAKGLREVMTDVIQPAMLPANAMWRNPTGAVDTYRRREGSAPVKRAILAWKRGMRALDPENEDQDYTNVERYRPTGAVPGAVSLAGDPSSGRW